jgi:phosphatidate cytidylyltransferase
MLKQRVITAIVLLALLLPALMASASWPFAVLTLVMMAAAGWEWGRLNGAGATGSLVMGAVVAGACAAALAAGWTHAAPTWLWWLATLVWVLGGAAALRAGPAGWPLLGRGLRWALGCIALCVAWLAIASAKAIGLPFILSIFCLVWVADIAAYFGGRTWGRRKLAPAISPGTSWAGVWTGMVGVLLLATVWVLSEGAPAAGSASSLFTWLWQRHGLWLTLPILLFLATFSVVGDLVESLVKRAAGMKDSSGLLPGHGGVLDRIDALLPVFPLAMAMSTL